jgi:hypothetical protein
MEPNDTIKTACPDCLVELKTTRQNIGKLATCKKCGAKFKVVEFSPRVNKFASNAPRQTGGNREKPPSHLPQSSQLEQKSKTHLPKAIHPPPMSLDTTLVASRSPLIPNRWQSVSKVTGIEEPHKAASFVDLKVKHDELEEKAEANSRVKFGAFVVSAILASAIFLVAILFDGYFRIGVVGLLATIFIGVMVIGISFAWHAGELRNSVLRLEKQGRDLLGSITQNKWKALSAVIIESQNPRSPLRFKFFSDVHGVIYTSEFSCLADIYADRFILLELTSIREANLAQRHIGASTYGTTSSNVGNAAAGALVGGLLFGGTGAIAGSVIGSSASQSTYASSVQHYAWVVDLFTRLEHVPNVTIDFDQDEPAAKDFYGSLNVGLDRIRQSDGHRAGW